MGGRGTFASGKSVAYTYETVGKIEGVKVLQPIDKKVSLKLPEESHSKNNNYILLDKEGVFHQYREYNDKHEITIEIGYHHEPKLGQGDVLHVHLYNVPGIDNRKEAQKFIIGPGDTIYEKYKKYFKGVNLK